MAPSTAYRLCPDAVFIRSRFDMYRAVSAQIREKLIQLFGKSGSYFYNIAHGNDDRPVEPNRIRKSIGKETTLLEDIDDPEQMLEILDNIAVRLENSLF